MTAVMPTSAFCFAPPRVHGVPHIVLCPAARFGADEDEDEEGEEKDEEDEEYDDEENTME